MVSVMTHHTRLVSTFSSSISMVGFTLASVAFMVVHSTEAANNKRADSWQTSDQEESFPVSDGPSQCKQGIPIVYVTISPLLYQRGFFSRGTRKLQMNWILCNRTPNSGDTVRLYWQDPSNIRDFNVRSASDNELDRRFPALSGRYLTNTVVPEFRFDEYDLQSNACLDYWLAYVTHDGQMLTKSCLARRPRWMEELREDMSNLKLSEVAIPGTHNAGSYAGYTDMVTETVRNKFLINQEESIFDQLVLGIRYLDIRVGYYPHTADKFFVNHDKVRIQPLQRVLDDITRFITKTKEILILDFHRFPVGFNPEIHEELISFILSQPSWARLALPKSPRRSEITLGEMWSSGHRLVLAYEDEAAENGNEFLWENVIHLWANTLETSALHRYLSRTLVSARQTLQGKVLYTANAFLTPQISDVFGGIQAAGLRVLADEVNRAGLDKWFAFEWRNNFTIVSTDFFTSNRMIALCEEVNAERAKAVRMERVQQMQMNAPAGDISLDTISSNSEDITSLSSNFSTPQQRRNWSPILRAVTSASPYLPTGGSTQTIHSDLMLKTAREDALLRAFLKQKRPINAEQPPKIPDSVNAMQRAVEFVESFPVEVKMSSSSSVTDPKRNRTRAALQHGV